MSIVRVKYQVKEIAHKSYSEGDGEIVAVTLLPAAGEFPERTEGCVRLEFDDPEEASKLQLGGLFMLHFVPCPKGDQ